jgi:predicted house-cleaning noncanonical NTP pyrophosphatase (MazG superfamily)
MKLVRDKIPKIMIKKGKSPITHFASELEFEEYLIKKLEEEVIEIKKDRNVEELADLLEVIYALGELIGVDSKKIEETRIKKIETNGGFSKKIILENPNMT